MLEWLNPGWMENTHQMLLRMRPIRKDDSLFGFEWEQHLRLNEGRKDGKADILECQFFKRQLFIFRHIPIVVIGRVVIFQERGKRNPVLFLVFDVVLNKQRHFEELPQRCLNRHQEDHEEYGGSILHQREFSELTTPFL